VVEKNIDGERAETAELKTKESRFGAVNAAWRVARTLILGSVSALAVAKPGFLGLNRARVLLGCFQPARLPRSTPTRSAAWPTGCTT
jgi:uncharacterized protein